MIKFKYKRKRKYKDRSNIKFTNYLRNKIKAKFTYDKGKKSVGRNNTGRITVRHRGGGLRVRIRLMDKHRKFFGSTATVCDIIRNKRFSSDIAVIKFPQTGLFSTLVCPEQLKKGSVIKFIGKLEESEKQSLGYNFFKPGFVTVIGNLDRGDKVHMLEAKEGDGAKFIRSSGAYGKIYKIRKFRNLRFFAIFLPSGMRKYVTENCMVSFGQVSKRPKLKFNKAGIVRRLGFRPKVRGVAMNPVDHPHGGGEGKSSGGRISVSKWGRLTKGKKTAKNYMVKLRMKLERRFGDRKKKKKKRTKYERYVSFRQRY